MIRSISSRRLLLLFSDIIAVIAAFHLSSFIRTGEWSFEYLLHPIFYLSMAVFTTVYYVFDLYQPFKYFKIGPTTMEILYSALLSGLILSALSYLDRTLLIARPIFVLTVCLHGFFVFCSRSLYDSIFRSQLLYQRVLIIGSGALARAICRLVQKTPHSGMRIVGFVSEHEGIEEGKINGLPIVGSTERLLSLVNWHNVDIIILAMEVRQKGSETDIMYALLRQDVKVLSAIHIFEIFDRAIPYKHMDEHYLLELMREARTLPYVRLKRLFDVLLSIFLLVVFSPVFLLVVIILSFEGPTKIFFVQNRIGKDGGVFKLLKLRTLRERDGKFKKGSVFGGWLRKFRIDEIPQLINVIKGDMSLVGPRPEIEYFVEKCRKKIPYYDAVFTLRPGLTGWAQINLLHSTDMKDYPRKFEYNLYYLKNVSFAVDFLIIIKTVRIVLLGKGK